MDEFLLRSWELLVGRAERPLHLRWVYPPMQSLVVAAVMALPTYLLVRGPTTRILARRSRGMRH